MLTKSMLQQANAIINNAPGFFPLIITNADGTLLGHIEDGCDNYAEIQLDGWSYGKSCVLLHLCVEGELYSTELLNSVKGV